MSTQNWHDLGPADEFSEGVLRQMRVGGRTFAVSLKDGKFGAISGGCNHVGGPLGEGRLEGEYVVCPWHYWKFHRITGSGEPGYEEDRVAQFEVKIEDGHLWVGDKPLKKRSKKPHDPHPLARDPKRQDGPIRFLGLSTTGMDPENPRISTSDRLLEIALAHARESLDCEVKKISLHELQFRNCEGFYSKSAKACTWPCSITQMDSKDQMDQVYEALVHWCDVILLATPIRWGAASSLYFKMAERLNCVQNQVTLANNVLIRNKVASFIITGGQDNVQAVAGSCLGFFSELGFLFPQFPFIAHSRGWDAEDMERNIQAVENSEDLREGSRELAGRSVELAKTLLGKAALKQAPRGGRKAQPLRRGSDV